MNSSLLTLNLDFNSSLGSVGVKDKKLNIEIKHLTRLVSIQSTISVNLERKIDGLKEHFETFKRKQNIREKSFESAWFGNTSILEDENLVSNQTRSSGNDNSRNNDDQEVSTPNHPSLDYNHTLHNLIAMANLSDYRLNELDAKFIKIHKTTDKNSQILHKAAINSYFENSQPLSDNTSLEIMGDLDSIVLSMKEDLDKIKFLVTGRYSSQVTFTALLDIKSYSAIITNLFCHTSSAFSPENMSCIPPKRSNRIWNLSN